MRRFVPLLLLLVMLCASASAEWVFCLPDSHVNVRDNPSGNVIGWIDSGRYVETDGKTKRMNGRTWVHVVDLNAEETEGWISSEFVSETPVNVEKRSAYSCAIGRLAIRKSPNGKIKGWLHNGNKCTVLADNGEWAITTYGYIKCEFLEFVEVLEDE